RIGGDGAIHVDAGDALPGRAVVEDEAAGYGQSSDGKGEEEEHPPQAPRAAQLAGRRDEVGRIVLQVAGHGKPRATLSVGGLAAADGKCKAVRPEGATAAFFPSAGRRHRNWQASLKAAARRDRRSRAGTRRPPNR